MISLALSISQDDCPLSAASASSDVAFVTPHWQYHHDDSQLELRVLADAADGHELEQALATMDGHAETEAFDLLAKTGSTARARLVLGTTRAMGAVAAHGGYVTGPFRNVDGNERWELGFDDERAADDALSSIDRYDEVVVCNRRRLDPATVLEEVRAREVGTALLEEVQRLTPTERETIGRALESGYYEVPRSTTLGDLAGELGVSDAAVSKTIRRAEKKVLSPTTGVLDHSSEHTENRSP